MNLLLNKIQGWSMNGYAGNHLMNLAGTNNVALAGGLQDSGNEAGLQEFIPEVWGASIQDYMERNLVFAKLATDQSALVAGGGDRIHLPRHTELTASDTYGGATAAVETLIDTNLAFAKSTDAEDAYTLDINQGIHSAISITDVAQVQSSYDVMNLYTSKLGYALAKKIDQYVSLKMLEHVSYNYAGGTADGNGAGNIILLCPGSHDSYDITVAGVAAMIEAVHTNDSRLEDFTMILTPKCYSSLFKLADFARYDGVGSSLGSQVPFISGYAGKLGGVDVVVSNNFTSWDAGSTTATTSSGTPIGNFSGNSIDDESQKLVGLLVHKDAAHIAFSKGMKARVQSDYHLPSLSTRFVADSVYGCTVTGTATAGNQRVFALCSPAS
tara:strand:+ start:375 stop:1523 length:1149 start_codon:yes stop_codon:yes gene_type:complete